MSGTHGTSVSDHVAEAIRRLVHARPAEVAFENMFVETHNFVRVLDRLSVDLHNKTTGTRINVYVNDRDRTVVVTKDDDGTDIVLARRTFVAPCTAADGQAIVDDAARFLDLDPPECATLSN